MGLIRKRQIIGNDPFHLFDSPKKEFSAKKMNIYIVPSLVLLVGVTLGWQVITQNPSDASVQSISTSSPGLAKTPKSVAKTSTPNNVFIRPLAPPTPQNP